MAGLTATVTFLFVDLVGSTDLLHRIGDDANDELTRAYQSLMRETVERHHGDVLRTMGDGLTVVFEHSVAAAVATAIDMHRAVDRMGRADPLLRLQIRVGLSVGEASRMDGDWSGTPIFEAARLESKARPGTILVNDVIRVLLGNRGGFEFTPVGALGLKGFPEPVPAAEVAWAPDPGRLEVPLAPALEVGLAWPLVGRTAEMERLEAAWRAVAGGAGGGRLVSVVGQAGAGKTRLAAELGARVQRGASGDQGLALGTVLYGAAEDVTAPALAPLAEALRWWAASVTPDRLREVVGDDAPTLAALVPSLGVRLPELVGGAVAVDVDEVAGAVVAVLRRATEGGPMLVVVDAAHAADEATVALVSQVVEAGLPILWLALARVPTGLAAPSVLATGAAETVELGGLDPFDVQDLLAEVVARQGFTEDDVSSEVAREVQAETRGNPRLVIETGGRLAVSGALGAGEPERRAQAVRRAVAGASPYKGLLAFQAEDADDFFGRDDDIAGLLGRVAAGRLLAVVGASGSGKSSLVRAGLLPALRRGALAGSEAWPVVLFNAGPRPLLELAAGLAGALDARAGVVMNTLESSVTGLHDVIVEAFGVAETDAARSTGPGRVVIVVDQFEEVFTACSDQSERERFAETLLHAASVPGGRALVVLVMRADFYGHCAGLSGMASPLESNNVLLGPMDEASLRVVIEDPARRAGLSIESGLVDVMIHDVVGEPGALPLLSHALYETWERREHRTLTVGGYRDAGGARGAIARTAEDVYTNRLDGNQQTMARDLFLRLTELGEGTEDTRRRVDRAELVDRASSEAELDQVLETLVGARLVTTDDETVEVAHEALIREWPRLRDWLDEDRETLRTLRGLDQAAAEWERRGKDPADLYRGARLVAALDATSDGAMSLTAVEAAFLDASRDAEEAERRAADERATEQARQNRRLRRLLAGVGVLLILALVAGVVAYQQRSQADSQRSRADQRTTDADFQRLVSQSENVLDNNRDLAFLLALEAVRMRDTPESRSALFRTLQRQPVPDGVFGPISTHGIPTASAVVGGRLLAYGTRDAQLGFIDLSTAEDAAPMVDLGDPPAGEVQVFVADDATRAEDGLLVVGRADSGQIWRIDPATHQPVGDPLDAAGAIFSLAASDRLGLVAAGREDGTVVLFDLDSGAQTAMIPAPSNPATLPVTASPAEADSEYGAAGAVIDEGDAVALAFSPTAGQLAVERPDASVELWDPSGPTQSGAVAGDAPVALPGLGTLVYRPDGAQVVAAVSSVDRGVRAIDTEQGTVQWAVETPAGRALPAYTPDGRIVFVAQGVGHIVNLDPATGDRRGSQGSALGFELAGISVTSDGAAIVGLSNSHSFFSQNQVVLPGPLVTAVYGIQIQHPSNLSPDDGTLLAAAGGTAGTFSLFDPSGGSGPQGDVPIDGGGFADDDVLAAVFADGTAGRYDIADDGRVPPSTPVDLGGYTGQTAVDPAHDLVAVGREDGTIDLYDTAGGASVPSAHADGAIASLGFSADGQQLVAVTSTNTAFVFDVRTGDQIGDPLEGASAATFDPTGRRLYVASPDGSLRELDARTFEPKGQPFPAFPTAAVYIDVSDDGSLLTAGSTTNRFRLYDACTRTQIGDDIFFEGLEPSGFVSHDGTFMVLSTTVVGGGLETWDLVPAHWQDAACQLAGRNLTQEEWDTYLPNAGAYEKTCEEWPAGP